MNSDPQKNTGEEEQARTPRTGPVAWVLVGLILVYRYTLSAFVGRTCRFAPTCSEYGVEALRRHGAWAGGWLTFFRFTRCRPGCAHGYDPVPETIGRHGLKFWLYAGYGLEKEP